MKREVRKVCGVLVFPRWRKTEIAGATVEIGDPRVSPGGRTSAEK